MTDKSVAVKEKTALSVTTPSDLIEMAIKQNADIDKLEKLMQLKERYEANEAKKEFVNARSLFSGESIKIVKNTKGHNSKYANLGDEISLVAPLLSKHGLSHSWVSTQNNGMITITCILTHVQGHSESTSLSSSAENSGSKNSIQAIGSAVSYLKRYTFELICGLASQADDNDGDKTETTKTNRAPIISQDIKDIVYNDTVKYLASLDDVGLTETWKGFSQDEKLVLWGMFNPLQRKSINAAMGHGEPRNG